MVLANLIISRILLISSIILLAIGGILGVIAFANEPYYVKEVTLHSYTKNSEVSIILLLKPNDIYEKTAIALTPSNSTYLSLVEEINVNHMLKVAGGVFVGDYSLTISLSHPDGWIKRYFSIMGRINGSTYSQSTSLNIDEIITYMESLCKQISVKVTQFDIVIEAIIQGYVKTNRYSRSDQLTHKVVIPIDLLINRISVRGDLVQNVKTDEKSSIQEVNYLLGFPTTFMRTSSLVTASIGFIVFLTYISMYVKIRKIDVVKDFESRYRELLVESKNMAELAENSIYVSSLEELVKIARLLEKPIIKIREDDTLYYIVLDKDIKYAFELKRK